MSGGRFDVILGQWYPEDCDEVLVGECPYCGAEIYEGDTVLKFDGEFFCNASCVAEEVGAYKVEAILERNE